ncbi:MAG: hypothetical protein DMF81_08265 [Acidobacteria bacterium]|nr:MAG: hypothetical protein DMF81_08265 [Acidobacteriota bacterium]
MKAEAERLQKIRRIGSAVLAVSVAAAVAVADDQAKPAPSPSAPASGMEQLYLVLLKRGAPRSAEDTPERQAIQEGHLANIRAMWKARKLIVAGPMGDDGELRGIFIFRVPTAEDVQALIAADPAIRSGRLVAEIHPWWVEKTVLPEAGEYCGAAGR